MIRPMKMIGLALAVAMTVSGCVAAVDGGEETLGTTAEPVTFSPATEAAYTWAWPSSPTLMTPIATSVCFLTDVRGLYRSSSDSLKIGIDSTTWQWTLKGTRGSGNPAGGARCVTVSSESQWSGSFSWSAGQAAVDMGSSTNRACFLTEINGTWDQSTDKVRARIASSGRWLLDGTTNSGGGSARCISSVFVSEEFAQVEGANDVVMLRNTRNDGPSACFITNLSGTMMGFDIFGQIVGGANARAFPHVEFGSPGDVPYHLQSDGSFTDVGVKARCIN